MDDFEFKVVFNDVIGAVISKARTFPDYPPHVLQEEALSWFNCAKEAIDKEQNK